MRFGERVRASVAPLWIRLSGFALLLIGLMVAVGVVSVASMDRVESASHEMFLNAAVPLEDLGVARAKANENRALLNGLLLETDRIDDAAAQARMRSNDELIDLLLRRVEPTLLTAPGRAAFAQLRRDLDRYAAAQADVLALHAAEVDPLLAYAFTERRALPAFSAVVASFDALFDSKVALAEARHRAIASIHDSGRSFEIVVLAAAVVIGIVVALLVARSIIGRLRAIQRAATRFGEGDLSAAVDVRGRAEIGQLAESFRSMATSLSSAQRRLHEHDDLVSAVYAIIAMDLDGAITVFNTGAELMLGYPERGGGRAPRRRVAVRGGRRRAGRSTRRRSRADGRGAGRRRARSRRARGIGARIVAAADAFSAITSDRVYERARERRDALSEMRAGAGTHFDPGVIDAIEVVLGQSVARPAGHAGVVEAADAA